MARRRGEGHDAGRLSFEPGSTVPVAFETNGKGWHGYLVQLPGAYVRGMTELDALAKVDSEVRAYLRWLGSEPRPGRYEGRRVQLHRSSLTVEDADNEILLDADAGGLSEDEFTTLVELIRRSGATFLALCERAKFKDWVDQSRVRRTFYGGNPCTVREIFAHVLGTQSYYMSRVGARPERLGNDFATTREEYLEKLNAMFEREGSGEVHVVDGESWTLKKVLRRFVWHDRIHGKAITRILERQRQLGLIEAHYDPFRFEL
ncbi:MAG: hypothetical protein LYZ69_09180 [Nitrososphaerales archaeon]|nr:hypothetical protein [Nitrososphaerales archaeon]